MAINMLSSVYCDMEFLLEIYQFEIGIFSFHYYGNIFQIPETQNN